MSVVAWVAYAVVGVIVGVGAVVYVEAWRNPTNLALGARTIVYALFWPFVLLALLATGIGWLVRRIYWRYG